MKPTGIIITLLSAVSIASAVEPTARQIVERMTEAFNRDQAAGTMTMTITTSGGDRRTFVYDSYSKNRGEKNLIRYVEPARVRGQAILMLNNADDIWVYFPRTKRVRKLATHAKKQKMEGSDFSYEDMGSGDGFLNDFTHERLEDVEYRGKDCFRIEMTAREGAESGYLRIVIVVGKEDYLMLAADYYDEDDPSLKMKHLELEDIREIQGVPTATKMTMRSLDDNSVTVMTIEEVDYKVNLSDELFTERGLRK